MEKQIDHQQTVRHGRPAIDQRKGAAARALRQERSPQQRREFLGRKRRHPPEGPPVRRRAKTL